MYHLNLIKMRNKKDKNQSIEAVIAKMDRAHNTAIQQVMKAYGKTEKNVNSKYSRKSYSQSRVRNMEKNPQNGDKMSQIKLRNLLSYNMFEEVLKQIGHSADTNTVAERLILTNAAAKRLHKTNPKGLVQFLYSSASYLVKQGRLTRKKLGHNYFEYSLKEWGKRAKGSKPKNQPPRTKQYELARFKVRSHKVGTGKKIAA